MATDGDRLAREAQEGSEEAFCALVNLYQERLYRVAYRILFDANRSLDVVQDAFVRIHGALPGWDRRSAFFSWAYRIVSNLALDALRKKRRRLES